MDLLSRVTADPRLPLVNPTEAYWQRVPHALARVKSSILPLETDVAIIGSGISGMNSARTILENDSEVRVCVFEARQLCSGATGRNGGQLVVNSAETYESMRNAVGPDMAGKIVRFQLRTLDEIRKLIHKYHLEDETQLVDVKKIRACIDSQTWEDVKRGIRLLEADHPSLKGIYEVVDATVCKEKYGVHGALGGAILPGGTVWPYRLVTSVFQRLMDAHGSRFNIETETPVTILSYDENNNATHPYLLKTPRGTVRAKQVIHCVNGYTGHLLPRIRGAIFPITGTMTVQDLGPQVPNRSRETSWAIHQKLQTEQNGMFHDGLQYFMQNSRSGLYFHGGEKVHPSEAIAANDDRLYPSSIEYLQSELSKLLGATSTKTRVVSAWSGVMGFSSDGMPLAGRLSKALTGREGHGEWIAGVYNGYGMSTAFLVAASVADWVSGKPIDSSFPEAYIVNEARLRRSLNTEATMKLLEDIVDPAATKQSKL